MMGVFDKIYFTRPILCVHNYYDSGVVVKLNFHPFSATRGNKFKLQKFNCHYNIDLVPELLMSGTVYQITFWRLTVR